jgi:L-alanine-DL-glutamate epimerase-like enolase superfamily enzyme
VPAYVSAGLDRVRPATTAYTISLDAPDAMAAAAAKAAARPILKIKLGGPDGDLDRIAAIRAAVPDATLIADANEGWTDERLETHLAACAAAGFALVEQPLPAGHDEALRSVPHAVPICADESVHGRDTLGRLVGLYDVVNIKLDKTGGLTEALALAAAAEAHGFGIMVGCMLGTSLGMAPAMLLSPRARFVDLDGPLLLARDRENGLVYDGSLVQPPSPTLWG